MKWIVYNLLFALAFPLMLPGFLLRMVRRGGYRARMGDRFAVYPPAVTEALAAGDFVWVHAVSVGEVQVAGQLMREWRKADPGVRFCFSTTSSTGWKMAEREVTPADVLIYNPLDFPNFVKSALKTVRPRAIVLTESEIWPVFIRTARAAGVPLFLINARVSDRSAPRYARARCFFKDVFGAFTCIFAQSELDRTRLLAAGAPADRVTVTGSFKFDVAHRNPAKESELRTWAGNPAGRILLGGSTWPGEDEALLRIYRKALASSPDTILILAPRHFEKADAVEANIRAAGFDCIRRSRGESFARPGANDPRHAVYLADTTGELMGLYGLADYVFIGKSLCEHGSQNMIEPCLCGKPTVVGPYTENFRPVMSDLLEGEGVMQVADEAGLEATLLTWLAHGDGGLGERAALAVRRRTGVVPACVAAIRKAITPRLEYAPVKLQLAPLLVASLFTALLIGATLLALCWRNGVWRSRGASAPAAFVIPPRPVDPKLPGQRVIGAFATMLEHPGARTALLIGREAGFHSQDFAAAGVKWATPEQASAGRRYDIVFVSGAREEVDWAEALSHLQPKGVLAYSFNVKNLKVAELKVLLESFPCPVAHLWMTGEFDWLLIGRLTERKMKMSGLLDFFSGSDRPQFITERTVAAGCDTLPGVLANYVGTRREILALPVFNQQNAALPVYVECCVPPAIPDLEWIVPDGVDEDIVASLAEGYSRLQNIRRTVLEAVAATRLGKLNDAVEAMVVAHDSNRYDAMLLDRIRQIAVNARFLSDFGKIQEAAQCYDILFAITPEDLKLAERYHGILLRMKRTEDAKKVAAHIERLKRQLGANEKGLKP